MSSELLVPLDGSKAAENVLPVAFTIAAACDLGIRFLEVLDPSVEGATGFAETRRSEEIFRAHAAELVERQDKEVPWTATCAFFNDAAETILSVANHCAMIALASHGRGGLRSALLGSVADRVIRGAHVPTIVVPALGAPPTLGTGPILVALDGSSQSTRTLPVARDLAARLGVGVALLESYLPNMVPVGPPETDYYPPNYIEELEAAINARLGTLALPGEETIARCSAPERAILEAGTSLDASLIALASSGKGLGRRIALGSTTSGVLHRWHRPLLIVPPPLEPTGGA